MTAPDTASFAGFARLLGVKPQAVTALRHAGRLVLTADGKRVDVAASQQRLHDTADPSKAGVVARHAAARAARMGEAGPGEAAAASGGEEGEDGDGNTPAGHDYQGSRARREHYQALEAQRVYEVAMGKLMDAGEVAAAVASAATTLRTRLESLPDVLGPQLASISDEAQVRATLAEAIEHALEECSRQFGALAREVA